MHGITNSELALLFSMFTLAPSVAFTLLFFILAKVFRENETAHKVLNIIWKIGAVAVVVSFLLCAFVYFS
jgi:hypothetical protein